MKVVLAVFLALVAYSFAAQWVVQMKERVNFNNLKSPLSGEKISELDFVARGRFVFAELQRTAAISQKFVRQLLNENHVQYKSFWISNQIILQGSPSMAIISLLKLREDVESVELVNDLKLIDGTGFEVSKNNAAPDWNIAMIKAPEAWAKGVTGAGVVVGMLDTGANFRHKDIVEKYKGRLANGDFDHEYNWFDGVTRGSCKSAPCDQNGHGSHVMGTILGDSGIGVAPKAKWMTCRSFATGSATITDIMNCLQWLLAPTKTDGSAPDSSKRASVVNHSWGAGSRIAQLEPAIDALHAAGSLQVFAAGNSGSRCSSLLYPGQYAKVLTVAAQGYQTSAAASFSSRGPPREGSYVKPDIAAPGQRIRSCSHIGDGYRELSGTSMATPHIVGSVALLYSAKSDLVGQIEKTIETVQQSADQLKTTECTTGRDYPNYVFGYGQVNNLKQIQ